MSETGLRAIEPLRVAGGLGADVLDSARFVVDDEHDVVAYALVALHADGHTSTSAKFDGPAPLNTFMFVGMVTEAVRNLLITRPEARSIVNTANGYDD